MRDEARCSCGRQARSGVEDALWIVRRAASEALEAHGPPSALASAPAMGFHAVERRRRRDRRLQAGLAGPMSRKLVFDRVAEEVFTNIALHAGALRAIQLRSPALDGAALLMVCYDGTGPRPGTPTASSHGIRGMRERVRLSAREREIEPPRDSGGTE